MVHDNMSGTFITIEGIDGSGKTSVVNAVEQSDIDVLTTKSPSDSWTGKLARQAIENRDVTGLSTMYLFMADMSYNTDKVIKPALDVGRSVVCDRYLDSTIAYQYVDVEGRVALPKYHLVEIASSWSVRPDVTIYLDITVDTAIERIGGESNSDRFEQRDVLQKVKEMYEKLADSESRYVIVDAERDLDVVIDEVLEIVEEIL